MRTPSVTTSTGTGTGKRGTLILAGVVILAAASLIAFKNLGGTGLMPKLQDVEPAAIGDAPAPAETAPAAAPTSEGAAPEAPGAMPPKPRPAELESGMPDPATLDQPEKTSAMEAFTDAILTGALPSKADSSLSALIAEPGANSKAATEAPPPAAGSEALRQAAASGNAAAQFVVASNYLDGKSVEQDFTKAASWYQKAAGQGLAPRNTALRRSSSAGRGMPQDIAAAGSGTSGPPRQVTLRQCTTPPSSPPAPRMASPITQGQQNGSPPLRNTASRTASITSRSSMSAAWV